jgi:hypothetical protein
MSSACPPCCSYKTDSLCQSVQIAEPEITSNAHQTALSSQFHVAASSKPVEIPALHGDRIQNPPDMKLHFSNQAPVRCNPVSTY